MDPDSGAIECDNRSLSSPAACASEAVELVLGGARNRWSHRHGAARKGYAPFETLYRGFNLLDVRGILAGGGI